MFPRFGESFGKTFRGFLLLFSKHAKTFGSQQNTAWAHEFLRSALKKTNKFCHKTPKKRCKFAMRKERAKKLLKNVIWEGLGLNLGGGWDALGHFLAILGRILVALGVFDIVSF